MNTTLFFSSINQSGRTPKKLYEVLDKEFNFDFDPCPNNPKFDGLTVQWGKSNYVNPPYNEAKEWIKKAYEESLKGKVCVMLLPSRTDTKIFHEIILPFAYQIRFVKGRLKFEQYNNSAPFPSMIVIFKGNMK
ncbi:MAG: adenine methyltransferase [Acidobacteria bacterium]|nr:adenine methyltransferase [Acidobacteriota bacterium]